MNAILLKSYMPREKKGIDESEYRRKIFRSAESKISKWIWEALYVHELSNQEFCIACIQANCGWRPLVDRLVTEDDQQEILDRNENAIVHILCQWYVCQIVADVLPEISEEALRVPSPDKFKVVVLSRSGCTIFETSAKAPILLN